MNIESWSAQAPCTYCDKQDKTANHPEVKCYTKSKSRERQQANSQQWSWSPGQLTSNQDGHTGAKDTGGGGGIV